MATKKSGLIVIVVLLGLGSLAEGVEVRGTFKIRTRYLDGTAFDPNTDVLDIIDDSLYLSMYAEEDFGWGSSYGYYWALVCDPSLATITGGVFGPAAYGGWIAPTYGLLYGVPGEGQHGKFEPDIWNYIYPAGLYLDDFLYSPQSVGDVTVGFWQLTPDSYGNPPYGIVDSIVINQVPEPITITLLGIGALLMRRRRIYSK